LVNLIGVGILLNISKWQLKTYKEYTWSRSQNTHWERERP
jgi:hypothetical protein